MHCTDGCITSDFSLIDLPFALANCTLAITPFGLGASKSSLSVFF
jgi:hypothetical protein